MNSMSSSSSRSKREPSVWMGLLLYSGYLAIVFTTWTINGIDYNRIGENEQTLKLWYALPTLFGCCFLVIAISLLGWWRRVLFEGCRSGPGWVWILPVAIALIIVHNLIGVPKANLTLGLLLWSVAGAVGVGFGEEMITRGSLIVGLRSRFTERRVWLISSLLFSALHVPNVIFGLPWISMPIQVGLTFLMGSAFYVIRRLSGTLILPMVLHGLWDSSQLLNDATGGAASPLQFAVYPLALVCVIATVIRDRQATLPE